MYTQTFIWHTITHNVHSNTHKHSHTILYYTRSPATFSKGCKINERLKKTSFTWGSSCCPGTWRMGRRSGDSRWKSIWQAWICIIGWWGRTSKPPLNGCKNMHAHAHMVWVSTSHFIKSQNFCTRIIVYCSSFVLRSVYICDEILHWSVFLITISREELSETILILYCLQLFPA